MHQRHSRTYRDQPRRTRVVASGTDWAMSPMDKVSSAPGSTLAIKGHKRERLIYRLDHNRISHIRRPPMTRS
ncbi:hypothetical protein APX70_06381 [Pseudomonas syringae pv. maculicola]|nr:hypothetical protein APX70_06381 [Pseudomonas syringae pv. maculicola]